MSGGLTDWKRFACELISEIYGESPSKVAIKTGGVGSFDESLQNAISEAKPLIQLDNVRGKLDSQLFE